MKTKFAALLAAGTLAAPAAAQDVELTLSEEQQRALYALLTAPAAAPGSAISIPSGFGASYGQIFASIGGTSSDGQLDGSGNIGMGFGNAADLVAFEAVLNIFSLTNNGPGSGVGEQGSVSVKVSRMVSPTSSVSLGVQDAARWGNAADQFDPSAYVAYSFVRAMSSDPLSPKPLTLTVGVGNERFSDLKGGVRSNAPGVFASVGFGLTRQFGVAMDYNGNYGSAGVSFVPIASQPLAVTVSVNNFSGVAAEDGGTNSGKAEIGASIGYSWTF